MSNVNLSEIGDWFKRNQADIAIFAGFILVAAIAFGAGRLSAPPVVRNPILIEETNTTTTGVNLYANVSQFATEVGESASTSTSLKGIFVASKNGKNYYWSWCGWAQRIKLENQVWFQTEVQAQAAGFAPSTCIKSEAPAGYNFQNQ